MTSSNQGAREHRAEGFGHSGISGIKQNIVAPSAKLATPLVACAIRPDAGLLPGLRNETSARLENTR